MLCCPLLDGSFEVSMPLLVESHLEALRAGLGGFMDERRSASASLPPRPKPALTFCWGAAGRTSGLFSHSGCVRSHIIRAWMQKQQRPAGLLNAPLRLYGFVLPMSNNAFIHNSLSPTYRHPGHSYGHLPGSYQSSYWRMLDDVSINSRYSQFTRVRRHHGVRRCNSSVGRAEQLTAYSRAASRGRFDAIGAKGATCLSTESTMYRTSQLKTSIPPQLTRTACVLPWDNRLVVAYDATRWICIGDIGIRQHIFFSPPIRPCEMGRCVVLGATC